MFTESLEVHLANEVYQIEAPFITRFKDTPEEKGVFVFRILCNGDVVNKDQIKEGAVEFGSSEDCITAGFAWLRAFVKGK